MFTNYYHSFSLPGLLDQGFRNSTGGRSCRTTIQDRSSSVVIEYRMHITEGARMSPKDLQVSEMSLSVSDHGDLRTKGLLMDSRWHSLL